MCCYCLISNPIGVLQNSSLQSTLSINLSNFKSHRGTSKLIRRVYPWTRERISNPIGVLQNLHRCHHTSHQIFISNPIGVLQNENGDDLLLHSKDFKSHRGTSKRQCVYPKKYLSWISNPIGVLQNLKCINPSHVISFISNPIGVLQNPIEKFPSSSLKMISNPIGVLQNLVVCNLSYSLFISNPIGVLQNWQCVHSKDYISWISNPIGVLQNAWLFPTLMVALGISNPIGVLQNLLLVENLPATNYFKSHRGTSKQQKKLKKKLGFRGFQIP